MISGCNLAESCEGGCGSKRAVFPVMTMMIMMMTMMMTVQTGIKRKDIVTFTGCNTALPD
jgi:hypothetical protein